MVCKLAMPAGPQKPEYKLGAQTPSVILSIDVNGDCEKSEMRRKKVREKRGAF